MKRVICLALSALLVFGLGLAISCGSDSGGGDDDSNDGATCDIEGNNLVEVPFGGVSFDCPSSIGVELVVSKVSVNAELTIVEIQGEYSINNGNAYYLRGEGLSGKYCFDRIKNAGSFTVRSQTLDCETYRTIDVTASTDPDAAAFCELSLDVDLNCPGDDDTIFDDDTYYDDDTVFDDDTADDDITLSCSDAVTYFYDTCGFAFGGDTGHPADYTKDEALAWCSSGAPDWFAQALACIEQYYGDCDQIGTCYSNIQQSDDDTYYDDDISPDDDMSSAPVLSDGLWDPTTLVLADYDDAPEQYWQSALMFSVCDLDNDLLPDGAVYIYLAGTTQWFLNTTNPINWSFFNSPPDVDLSQAGDCGAPVQTGVTIGFGPASAPPAAGDYCVDIEATDSAGNFSNKLVNLCVTMASM